MTPPGDERQGDTVRIPYRSNRRDVIVGDVIDFVLRFASPRLRAVAVQALNDAIREDSKERRVSASSIFDCATCGGPCRDESDIAEESS